MQLANRLADYAARLRYEQLDAATVHEVRRRLIDSLACALGAYDAGAPSVARRIASRISCRPGASFLGGRTKTSPDLAAFTNGVLFRYLDYNDTYLSLEPAHPSDNFAAVLAAAEVAGAVSFLCGPDAGYITGSTVNVDGGLIAMHPAV